MPSSGPLSLFNRNSVCYRVCSFQSDCAGHREDTGHQRRSSLHLRWESDNHVNDRFKCYPWVCCLFGGKTTQWVRSHLQWCMPTCWAYGVQLLCLRTYKASGWRLEHVWRTSTMSRATMLCQIRLSRHSTDPTVDRQRSSSVRTVRWPFDLLSSGANDWVCLVCTRMWLRTIARCGRIFKSSSDLHQMQAANMLQTSHHVAWGHVLRWIWSQNR